MLCHRLSLPPEYVFPHFRFSLWINGARYGGAVDANRVRAHSKYGLPLTNSSKAERLLIRGTANVVLAERADSPTAKKKEAGMKNIRARLVKVKAYVRKRFGRQETVCAHVRSMPRQLSFNF